PRPGGDRNECRVWCLGRRVGVADHGAGRVVVGGCDPTCRGGGAVYCGGGVGGSGPAPKRSVLGVTHRQKKPPSRVTVSGGGLPVPVRPSPRARGAMRLQ